MTLLCISQGIPATSLGVFGDMTLLCISQGIPATSLVMQYKVCNCRHDCDLYVGVSQYGSRACFVVYSIHDSAMPDPSVLLLPPPVPLACYAALAMVKLTIRLAFCDSPKSQDLR